MGVKFEPFFEFFFNELGPPFELEILWGGSFFPTPLSFSANREKIWFSGKSKTTKVCFRTFPDLWRHSYFFSVPNIEIDLSH